MENNCHHYDYGKSADKALGAYCTAKKKLVEPEDCEGCVPFEDKSCFTCVYIDCPIEGKNKICESYTPFGCEEGEEE